jgi:hypothetical protein
MHKKSKVSLKAFCFCLVLLSTPLAACSSSAQPDEVTTTTIDPQILELQEKVETLESILNTTTTTATTKPAKTIVETRRWASGVTNGDQHECRETVEYSDGTQVETSRWWAKSAASGYPRYPC